MVKNGLKNGGRNLRFLRMSRVKKYKTEKKAGRESQRMNVRERERVKRSKGKIERK